MGEEFNLSEKINYSDQYHSSTGEIIGKNEEDIDVEDVKEFIRRLKDIVDIREWKAINRLAGGKLI